MRLRYAVVVVIGVSLIIFILVRLTGDPTYLLLPTDVTREDLEAFREFLGIDRPFHLQYITFLGRAVRGDFGLSFRHRVPAMALVLERFPSTMTLALCAIVLAVGIGIPAGVISATRRNTVLDALVRATAIAGQSMPGFWLGILLILAFSVSLRILPSSGRGSLAHLVLPSVTLSFYFMATIMRLMRSSLLEVLNKDYVRTARAKGLNERVVLYKHAFRNAAIPVLTVLGLHVGVLLGGAIVTETVFAYPGMGLLAVQAIQTRDFPVVQAFVLVVSIWVVLVNLVVDVICSLMDPRIKLG